MVGAPWATHDESWQQHCRVGSGANDVPGRPLWFSDVRDFGSSASGVAMKSSLRFSEGMPRRLLTIAPEKLRSLREHAGITPRELAESVGVTYRMVRYWEDGTYAPEARNIACIAKALKCTAAELTGTQRGSEALIDLRYAAGLTAEDVASRLRVTPVGRDLSVDAVKVRNLERGRRVLGRKWSDPFDTGRLVKQLATLYEVPVRMVLDAWMRTRPREPVPALPLPQPKPPAASALAAWEGLNARQHVYLGEIMRDDRMTEAEIWMRRVNRLKVPKASEWRKLTFALRAPAHLVGYTRIQERLRRRGVHDPGAGATLQALSRGGLLTVVEDQVDIEGLGTVERVRVEMTRRGRAAARAGLDEPRETGPPQHLLSDWLWRMLVRVASAGPEGLHEDELAGKSLFYLAVGYSPRPGAHPSRGFIESRPVMSRDRSHVKEYRWHLTALGTRHFTEYMHVYKDMYPEVLFPDSVHVSEDPSPFR